MVAWTRPRRPSASLPSWPRSTKTWTWPDRTTPRPPLRRYEGVLPARFPYPNMSCELTVATFNLWGLNEPWAYTERRREVRGAAPGSPATTLRVPDGAWTRRRSLIAQALAGVNPDIVGLQEDRQDLP